MDTISRDNTSSMLPVFGVIAGVIGLILGGIGIAQASKANKALEALQPKIDKIDAVETAANSAAASADGAKKELTARVREIQENFNLVGAKFAEFQGSITKIEEAQKAKAVVADKAGKKGDHGPVVAGPGEYVVKSGDTGTKIAAANKVSVGDLVAVNPGVNFNRLSAGQKLKLPAKK